MSVSPPSSASPASSAETPRDAAGWLLDTRERGNPHTGIDRRRGDGLAWTTGNDVTPLIHGAPYYRELLAAIGATGQGDLILFTDWRGDPDEDLDGNGTDISGVFAQACRRGVDVRGLVWRSHLDSLQFSAAENRHLGEEIDAAGGQCLLDMRVRTGGSHHQKMVVLRHPGRPDLDVAYLGGIDLCHSRRDDEHHHGDPQSQAIAPEYGSRPPWHDIQFAVRGPAVGDIETTFRERWDDPTPPSRNPIHRLQDALDHDNPRARPLPAQLPDPAPRGNHTVQVLRTYPYRHRGYPFAPDGERSVARGYAKALGMARELVYIEDQYLWSAEVAAPFARALAANPGMRLIAVVPVHPDETGLTRDAQQLGRRKALDALRAAGGDRVAVYGLENAAGTPVYVHAKITIIDDTWTCAGSDNLNLRSWTHDSEASCVVLDEAAASDETFGRRLRVALAREHLGRAAGDDLDLGDPVAGWEAFRASAAALDGWHASGRHGPRPPGQLRAYSVPVPSSRPRWLVEGCYRWICDPDGRRRSERHAM